MLKELATNPLTYLALALIAAFATGSMYRQVLPANARRLLLAGGTAGVALLLYLVFRPPEPGPPPKLLDGELSVPAYQSGGTPFQNYMKFPIRVEFTAGGQWSLNQYPDSVSGPGGRSAEPGDRRYRLPSAPAGALILQWPGTGEYELVGEKKIVELLPEQKLLFMINDFKSDKAYADNTGVMKIHWTCFNCLHR